MPVLMSERVTAEVVSITFTFANEIVAVPIPTAFVIENESLATFVMGRPSRLPRASTSTSPLRVRSARLPIVMSVLVPSDARSKCVALVV